MKILLIAGHGQGDPGACGNGYEEATLTRELSQLIYDRLKSSASVDLYPPSQNCVKQSRAGNIPNYAGYDYVFEVHFNSASTTATGTEILVHKNEAGVTVENNILGKLREYFKNRGVKYYDNLLNMNNCKSRGTSYALLETCFISNAGDISIYQNHKSDIATRVVQGICEGFGLDSPSNTGSAVTPIPSTKKIYLVQCGAFRIRTNAEELVKNLGRMGFESFIKTENGLYIVQAGAYTIKKNAEDLVKDIQNIGYEAIIKERS